MKKYLIALILVLASIHSFGQKITYHQDVMTDKYYYNFYDSKGSGIVLISEDQKEGFILTVFLKESGETTFSSTVTPSIIYAKLALAGASCVEEGFIIFLFKDASKIKLNNWKKFNCDGEFYFSPQLSDWKQLYTKEIDKIMLQDGRSYKSYTYNPSNPLYFIELYESLNIPLVKEE